MTQTGSIDGAMPEVRLHVPAPADLAAQLHRHLAEAGQALAADRVVPFLMSMADEAGRMVAGCKGEIAFTAAHVSELWVAPDWRGRGLGSRLLAAVEAHARDRGCSRVHLETRNPAARALYEKQGYTVFGQLDRYDGETPFWYLQKPLATG